MAIVDMKHVDMLALDRDRPALLRVIQKLGCFQLQTSDAEDVTFNRIGAVRELPALEETLNRVAWSIQKLNRYDTTKKALMADKPSIDETQAEALLERESALLEVVSQLEALEREAGDLRGQAARVAATREQLMPWRTLALPLEEVHATRNTVAMLGTVRLAALDAWNAEHTLGDLCAIEMVSTERDLAYVYVLAHRDQRDALMQALKDGGFAPVTVPQGSGTAEQRLETLRAEDETLDAQLNENTAKVAALGTHLNDLRFLHDLLQSKRQRLLAVRNLSASERTFFLQGWVPEPMIPKVEEKLKAVSPTVALEFYDPAEGEEPPVLLHNAPAFRPFESVVASYDMPSVKSLDPTAVMTPFFVNFMGMMISDAGYGLMMMIMAPILIKVLKPGKSTQRMLLLLMAGGIATLFWGAMYNSWFGFAPWPFALDPMNNALPVMGIGIGLGALHMFTGLGVAAYLNIRRGNIWAAIADQVSWFLLVVGMGLMIVVPVVGKWLAMLGAAIILLTAGRGKTKNPIKRLLSGLGALYGITGWLSDLLSYIRLFGMGLATGVIGMVINILAGIAMSNGIVGIVAGAFVFVGGHLFNAGINIFGAYVHSCRLQYIEFFGKFFEGGGLAFRPLSYTDRYVYVRDNDKLRENL